MFSYPNVTFDQQQVRQAYETLLSRWKWELHITLSYYRRVDSRYVFRDAKFLLHKFRRKFPKIKFAAVLIYSIYQNNHPHVHILMTSDQSYPKTLSDLDWARNRKEGLGYTRYGKHILDRINLLWESCMSDKATCKVTKDWSNEIICSYIAKSKNITIWDADRWEFDYYRPNLLKRLALRESKKFI
jgi:hypothetical protein